MFFILKNIQFICVMIPLVSTFCQDSYHLEKAILVMLICIQLTFTGCRNYKEYCNTHKP